MKPLTVNEIHKLLNRVAMGGMNDTEINEYLILMLTRNNNNEVDTRETKEAAVL